MSLVPALVQATEPLVWYSRKAAMHKLGQGEGWAKSGEHCLPSIGSSCRFIRDKADILVTYVTSVTKQH